MLKTLTTRLNCSYVTFRPREKPEQYHIMQIGVLCIKLTLCLRGAPVQCHTIPIVIPHIKQTL